MDKPCPNYHTCRLVQTDDVVTDNKKKSQYISDYCQKEETWKKCKRYITRRSLWICPDFVLPDSELTEEQIIKKHGKEKDKP
jgi:hypothetical protein